MSLLPYVIDRSEPAHDYLGFGIFPRRSWITPVEKRLFRSLENLGKRRKRLASFALDDLEKEPHVGKDGFQVSMDVQPFAPNEISVKTVDNSIVVEAKHEERKDEHGYISRSFCRRYQLPEGFNADEVVSTISSDGILTLKAPPVTPAIEGPKVRHVQIQQTGPARLSANKNEEKKADQEKPEAKKKRTR